MKILIISPTQKGIGGVARHVQGLSNFLIENGHTVDILSSENTFTIPIRKLKNPSFMISAALKTSLRKGYDIVHAQNPPAALAMKSAKGKKVLSIHGIHHEQVDLLHGKTASNLAKKFEDFALHWADAITVSSKEMYDYYSNKGYKVYYLPNAIDVDDLPKGKTKEYEKQIVYAARLSKEKGILDVLTMAERLPDDIHLLILGSGVEERNVLALCKKRPNIHYLGYQDKQKTIEFIRGSDILIQPSLMEGGTSYTLLESMACKTPIICTDVGGGKDLLCHMENAYLIKPQSPDELFNAIMDLMSDEQKRNKLAENAYNSVLKYDWKVIGQMYLKLYNEILNQSKRNNTNEYTKK